MSRGDTAGLVEKNACPNLSSKFAFFTWVWLYFVAFLLVTFSIAQYFPVVTLLAMFVAVIIFFLPFFGSELNVEQRLLAAAVSVGVLVTALYPPVVGFFMGLQGGANSLLVKLLLGIRSSFFSFWVLIALLYFSYREKKLVDIFSLALFASVMALGLTIGGGGFEPRITYLLNSFLSLFATVGVVFFVLGRFGEVPYLDGLFQRIVIFVAILGIPYFPILMLNLDIFRPDLALMHQMVEGRGLDGTLPPQWQSLLFDQFVPRFVGTFPNPILYGYFCAISSFVFFVKGRSLISGVLFLMAMMTLSKGAILLALSAMFFFYSLRFGRIIFVVSFFAVIFVELLSAYLLDGSNRVHLRGLIGGVQSVLSGGVSSILFGFGLGSGGNLSRAALVGGPTSEGWLASGSESGIGSLIYQLGFCGLGYFSFLACRVLFFPISVFARDVGRSYAIIALCAAWFANMLLQEDLINVTISSQILMAIFMIVCGGVKRDRLASASNFTCRSANC